MGQSGGGEKKTSGNCPFGGACEFAKVKAEKPEKLKEKIGGRERQTKDEDFYIE